MWSILANVLARFLPEKRDIIYLSFALADPNRLEGMLADAGFRDIGVERESAKTWWRVLTIIGIQSKQGPDLYHKLTSPSPKWTAARCVRR
jgi:hypothetical protein